MGFECCKSHRGDELNPRQMRRLWRNLLTFDDIFGHPQVSSWLAASCRLTRRLPSSTCAADWEVTYHMTRLPNAQVPWEPKQQKQHVRLLSSGQSWLFQTGLFFFVGQNFLVSFYDFRRRPRWREIDGPWSKHPLISHQINEQTHRLSGVGSHLLRWCGPSRHRLSDWLVAGLPLVTDWPARGHSSRRLMASSHYVTHSFHISFIFKLKSCTPIRKFCWINSPIKSQVVSMLKKNIFLKLKGSW